jgi:hypothetical protein
MQQMPGSFSLSPACKPITFKMNNLSLLPLFQTLVFMKMSVVETREAVVLWAKKAMVYTSISVNAFRSALKSLKLGTTQEKKDLLKAGQTDTNIKRASKNSVRQSCMSVFMDDKRLPHNLVMRVKKGNT